MTQVTAARGLWGGAARIFSLIGEGNRLLQSGVLRVYIAVVSVLLTGYITWYALFSSSNRHLHAAFFIAGVLPIVFLTTTGSKACTRLNVVDYVLAAVSLAVGA